MNSVFTTLVGIYHDVMFLGYIFLGRESCIYVNLNVSLKHYFTFIKIANHALNNGIPKWGCLYHLTRIGKKLLMALQPYLICSTHNSIVHMHAVLRLVENTRVLF
jgi:hypothetical protein